MIAMKIQVANWKRKWRRHCLLHGPKMLITDAQASASCKPPSLAIIARFESTDEEGPGGRTREHAYCGPGA